MFSDTMKAALPNVLSGIRLLIAPYVLVSPVLVRPWALILCAATDFLDGYLARRWRVTSRFGVFIDPIGDKLTALAFSYVFWTEGHLTVPQLLMLFSRDMALILFVVGAWSLRRWNQWTIQSFFFGKVATALQFATFLWLSLGLSVPSFLYAGLLFCGVASLPELCLRLATVTRDSILSVQGRGSRGVVPGWRPPGRD